MQGLFPLIQGLLGFQTLSVIRYFKKHNISDTGSTSVLRWGLGLTRGLEQIQFLNCCVLQCSLEYWRVDKVQKPSNPECYTSLSEPFRIELGTYYVVILTFWSSSVNADECRYWWTNNSENFKKCRRKIQNERIRYGKWEFRDKFMGR